MGERVACPRFVGGTNFLVSLEASNERTINWYPETTGGGGKTKRYLRHAEGLNAHTIIDGVSNTRGMFAQDGRAFCVTGTKFNEIFDTGLNTNIGTVLTGTDRATFGSNGSAGHQIAVCCSGKVYVYDTVSLAFSQVMALDAISIRMIEFMDGYLFALEDASRRVYYSAIEDFTTWDLTFGYFERSWGSDNISFIKRSGRQLWVVGTKTTEVWADNGNATNPFAPIQGAFLDIGSMAPFCHDRDGDTITWLHADERGGCLVVQATGYDPDVKSNYSIAAYAATGSIEELEDAEAFVHQIHGHKFFWLHIGDLATTPVYDFAEQEWHERAMWDSAHATWEPHIARTHCYIWNKHLVGTRTNGVIYQLSADFLDNYLVDV